MSGALRRGAALLRPLLAAHNAAAPAAPFWAPCACHTALPAWPLQSPATTSASAAAGVSTSTSSAAQAATRSSLQHGRTAGGVELGKAAQRATMVQYPFPVDYYAPKRIKVLNLEGEVVDIAELPGDVFGVPVRVDILQRVVRWQRARRQQGTHKAKTRAEVRGGGKKPWRQKGTGRARAGSIRAPQWRGGGVAWGPIPRSHAHALPKKVRRLGLRCALSAKAHEGRLLLLDSLRPDEPRTKLLAEQLNGLLAINQQRLVNQQRLGEHDRRLLARNQRRSALLVDAAKEGVDGGEWLRRAARNLPGVEVVPQLGANVYSILRRDVLVLTRGAAEALVGRLRTPINRLGLAGAAYAARMEAARAEVEALEGQQQQQQQQQQRQLR